MSTQGWLFLFGAIQAAGALAVFFRIDVRVIQGWLRQSKKEGDRMNAATTREKLMAGLAAISLILCGAGFIVSRQGAQPPNLAATEVASYRIGIGHAPQLMANFAHLSDMMVYPKPKEKLNPNEWSVILSGPAEHTKLLLDIGHIIQESGSGIKVLSLPDYQTDPNAPKFVEVNLPGITIHGEGNIVEYLRYAFAPCFNNHKSREMPADAYKWYGTDKLVWAELGPGLPWQPGHSCEE
jgi:hypothetical protein